MCTSLELWNNGAYEIEWVPPTDEERKMYRKIVAENRAYASRWNDFCEWEVEESGHKGTGTVDMTEIAESLAMDGL